MFSCSYCKKEYKQEKAFRKHELQCFNFHRDSVDDTQEYVPSASKMYKMIKFLFKENKKLKKRITSLEGKVNRKSVKINLLEWLQKNNNIIFDEKYCEYNIFIEKLTNMSTENIELIIKLRDTTLIDTIKMMFAELLNNEKVFLSAKSKQGVYVYKDSCWQELSGKLFEKLYQIIQKKLICCFCYYQQKKQVNDTCFNNITMKLYGGEDVVKTQKAILSYLNKSNKVNIQKNLNIKIT